MPQKIIKIGTSAGVTIPKESLEKMKVKVGDEVVATIRGEKLVIWRRGKTSEKQNKITELTLDFIERYREDLEALSDK